MTDVYLDSNAIGDLVPKAETVLDRARRDALVARTTDKRLSVIASVELLQELLAIGDANWAAHQRIIGFLRQVAMPAVLLDTRGLSHRELRVGRRLRPAERYADLETSKKLWAEVLERQSVFEVTAAAKAEAATFANVAKALREQVDLKLASVTPKGESVPRNVRVWWEQDPFGHIRDFALRSAKSIAGVPATYPVETLPALWNFHAYMGARIFLLHGTRHAIKPTDLADAHHYAAAAYADVFVSSDGALRKVVSFIPNATLPLTLDEFAEKHLGTK